MKCARCGQVISEGMSLWNTTDGVVCEDCIGEYSVCAGCHEVFHQSDGTYDSCDTFLCEECRDGWVECDDCGQFIRYRDVEYLADETPLCRRCLRSGVYVRCDDCGGYYRREDADHDACGIWLCDRCFEYSWYRCNSCGNFVHEYDMEGDLCPDCAQSEHAAIHDHSYKPHPVFFGGGSRLFLGVEVEIDGGGCDDDNAEVLGNITGDYAYYKYDGSLNKGFELVTHPCTLKFHEQNFPWLDFADEAIRLGYRSHDTDTCGIHVHMSREFFEVNGDDDGNVAKLLYFVEKFWDKLVKFSRRSPDRLHRWAARYDAPDHNDPKAILDYAKGVGDRYRCVNLTNRHTIEIRIFRGSLNVDTIIATLQLCDHMARYCVNNTTLAIQSASWEDFVATIPSEHTELIAYLKRRGIYDYAPQSF